MDEARETSEVMRAIMVVPLQKKEGRVRSTGEWVQIRSKREPESERNARA
jgi:hypothetical protein